MVLLKDIAREVGVSVSVVSKVLNNRLGSTGVRACTVREIHATARRLGYRKNASSMALLQGRHNVLGVYIHRLGMVGSGIIDSLLEGISEAARKHQQRQALSFYESTEEVLALCDAAHPSTMDGLLLAGIAHREVLDRLQSIRDTGLPIATVHDDPVGPGFPNAGMDQVWVGRMATEHLIERGARKIAHIVNTADRYQGYREALAAAGLPEVPSLVFPAHGRDYSHKIGEAAVKHLLANGVEFDGIVAQSDQEAVGCLNALFELGRRVPDDLRVIGIDNAPYCEFARVPLSSVSQEFHQRGFQAVEMLMAMIGGGEAESVRIAPVLHARQSSR